ncbi:MAG: helix-turn-helix domain-containing protein [Mycobacterium sp.]
MHTKKESGPTGDAVAANVKRLREEDNLTFTQLSQLLELRAGWEISATALRRIEEGDRRVSVDDLAALAVAFVTSPATLLMPHHTGAGAKTKATGTGPQNASALWYWLTARGPVKYRDAETRRREGGHRFITEFWLKSWPVWEHDNMAQELRNRKHLMEDRRRRSRERQGGK